MKKNICASWFTDTYQKTNIITTDRRPTITIHMFVKTYQNIYLSKYCNLAVSTSFRIFLSESSEAAALLPIFPLFDSEQIPGNMMGAAARRPKSSATTTNTTTTIPSSPWPRLFRGRDGTAQQPAAYCVCVWPPLSFSLFCTLDQMRSQMWCGCDLAKMPMMRCLLFSSNGLVKQMMLIVL